MPEGIRLWRKRLRETKAYPEDTASFEKTFVRLRQGFGGSTEAISEGGQPSLKTSGAEWTFAEVPEY